MKSFAFGFVCGVLALLVVLVAALVVSKASSGAGALVPAKPSKECTVLVPVSPSPSEAVKKLFCRFT